MCGGGDDGEEADGRQLEEHRLPAHERRTAVVEERQEHARALLTHLDVQELARLEADGMAADVADVKVELGRDAGGQELVIGESRRRPATAEDPRRQHSVREWPGRDPHHSPWRTKPAQ